MKRNPVEETLLARYLSRRQLLGLIGATAAAPLVGCARGQATEIAAASPADTAAPSCVVRPQQTEGPYFVDEKLNRSDIRTDPTDGVVRQGLPLRLVMRVSKMTTGACAPLAGAIVDLWQCDAVGVYSDVRDEDGLFDTRGKKFLRGYQVTDATGKAEFMTIYPGWYPGRTVHIHFKIRTDFQSPRGHEFTSQLYFDDAISDKVFATAPYASKGKRTARNQHDGIFRNGGDRLTLPLAQDGQGYLGTFDIALKMA
ncbi:MAG TPA: intradiol ring-cleavage dioxygenase [Blastocatellia bacterium]|nr:intradiol ring-cleavage dioxygenase [Blastocatellia bacterium]